ncbi:MAG: hypothetical protein ACRDVP_01505, partial [Acidimicrobiales bacterium]
MSVPVGRRDDERRPAGQPLWFGPKSHPLFGWVHSPVGGLARGAVVLCPPLALELAATQSCYRELARGLARSGMVAVRFDYEGTGDSSGEDDGPARVEAWLSSIEEAVKLAGACGAERISLLGMRMGALLAAASLGRLGPIADLVLWDPCSSGRSFLREQAALGALHSDVEPIEGPGVELPGFVFGEDTVSDLKALCTKDPPVPPERILLLARPNHPGRLELLERLGTGHQVGEACGQEDMLEVHPGRRQLPRHTMEMVTRWLSEPRCPPSSVTVPAQDSAFLGGSAGLTERALRLGTARLFAIETLPSVRHEAPTVVILNSGTDWHVGPNRLWVDLARRWASEGFRCVRMDESGLGDSLPRAGRPLGLVRAPEAFDDIAEATASLEPQDPSNVIFVGL